MLKEPLVSEYQLADEESMDSVTLTLRDISSSIDVMEMVISRTIQIDPII